MIKLSPRNKNKSGKRRAFFAMAFFALCLVATVPEPAVAQTCCAAEVTTAAKTTSGLVQWIQSNSWLSSIFSTISDIFSFFQNLLGPVTKQGFAAVAGATVGSSETVADTLYKKADFDAQANKYNLMTQSIAQDQANSVVSDKASSCAVTQLAQDMEQMPGSSLGAAHTPIAVNICKGSQANCQGPDLAIEQTADRLALGFVTPGQNGSLFPNAATPQPGYEERDNSIDALLGPMQYQLATPCFLKDGYPYFSGQLPQGVTCASGTAQTPKYDPDVTKSQLAFVAAYKFCEGLMPHKNSSTYGIGRAASGADTVRANDEVLQTRLSTAASEACMHSLWGRTACPAGSDQAAQDLGGGPSCHERQVTTCTHMKTDPNPSNVDQEGKQGQPATTTSTGNGYTAAALQDCETNGLSEMMARSIKAHKCADQHYMDTVLPGTLRSSAAVEQFAAGSCDLISGGFEMFLMQERSGLMALIAGQATTWRAASPAAAAAE